MQAYGLLGAYLLSLSLLAVPLGAYVHRVMQGAAPPLFGVLRPVECALYRIAAIDPGQLNDQIQFPGIDKSAVQEVLLTTSAGRCFVIGPNS